jgi:hypothetical protein
LLRGKYHELVVGTKAQVIRHPLRAEAVDVQAAFSAEKTQYYFTSALLADVFQERRAEDRVKTWVVKVMKARLVARSGNLHIFDDDTPGKEPLSNEQALQNAVAQALKFDLAGPPAQIERFIDLAG